MTERPPGPSRAVASGPVSCDERDVVVATLRALLRATSRAEAARLLQEAVVQLGGEVVPAREAGESDLPVDVSLGVGEPLVVRLPDDPPAARFLAAHAASIVEDALCAALRSDRHEREAVRATTDTLTRVASRAEIGPRLGVAAPGDVVCLLDLDHFKRLNDTRGHPAGDATLQAFGALLLAYVRDVDFVGRYGGDEFVIVLRDTPVDIAYRRMQLLGDTWRSSGDHGTGVSIGVAPVDERGGAVAVRAADVALYRAKRSGRGGVERSRTGDDTEVGS